jgi:hypothetical protein
MQYTNTYIDRVYLKSYIGYDTAYKMYLRHVIGDLFFHEKTIIQKKEDLYFSKQIKLIMHIYKLKSIEKRKLTLRKRE